MLALKATGMTVTPLYALPDTHRIVPVEPTMEMLMAGYYAANGLGTPLTITGDAYKAMLAAAPGNEGDG